MCKIAPSILAADFSCLGEQLKQLEDSGVEILHVDVMDGVFVPSISFGMPVISSIRKASSLFFDVHLMIQNPERYLEDFAKAGADSLTIHVESCEHPKEVLRKIKELGMKAAIALNPETEPTEAEPYLPYADMVLVMSVHPGFGGQKLIPETLEKVSYFAKLREEKKMEYAIEIDGGVNRENIGEIVSKGVDIFVAGTAVFSGDIRENVKRFEEVR